MVIKLCEAGLTPHNCFLQTGVPVRNKKNRYLSNMRETYKIWDTKNMWCIDELGIVESVGKDATS